MLKLLRKTPIVLLDIILNYKSQLIHVQKFKKTLKKISAIRYSTKYCEILPYSVRYMENYKVIWKNGYVVRAVRINKDTEIKIISIQTLN